MLPICLTLALMLTLAACGSPAKQGGGSNSAADASPSASDTPEAPLAGQPEDLLPAESEEGEETGETKILIADFSAATTRRVSQTTGRKFWTPAS